MTDPAPVVLNDRYELREVLGRGGMAEVRHGVDRLLDRDVAVKLMNPALGDDADRRRFTSEMRLLARLNNPHLVTLLDAGVDETHQPPRPWLVMELVSGPALSQRFADGPIPSEEVAAIGADIASALAHVHANGIVHRDVKPANVLLTPTGGAKLADFGIARLRDEQSDLTAAGHTIGTAAYLSPEQVSGLGVAGASDVYSLGLVLLEALTGRREYTGPPTEAALARLVRRPLIPVSLGAAWVRLLDAMTATDPADRPDAREAAEQLGLLRAGTAADNVVAMDDAGSAATRTVSTPAVAPARRRRATTRRRRPVLALVGAAASLAIGVGTASVGNGLADPATPAAEAADVSTKAAPKRKPADRPSSTVEAAAATSAAPVSLTPARSRTPKRTGERSGDGASGAPDKTRHHQGPGKSAGKSNGGKSHGGKGKSAGKGGSKGKGKGKGR